MRCFCFLSSHSNSSKKHHASNTYPAGDKESKLILSLPVALVRAAWAAAAAVASVVATLAVGFALHYACNTNIEQVRREKPCQNRAQRRHRHTHAQRTEQSSDFVPEKRPVCRMNSSQHARTRGLFTRSRSPGFRDREIDSVPDGSFALLPARDWLHEKFCRYTVVVLIDAFFCRCVGGRCGQIEVCNKFYKMEFRGSCEDFGESCIKFSVVFVLIEK